MTTAYKEWKIVCHALLSGDQHLLLRKGGISEGKEGFDFKNSEFILFPTLFHEQKEKVRIQTEWKIPSHQPETIEICAWAKITWKQTLSEWENIQNLLPYHIWSEQTVRDRFQQKPKPELHLAVVRIYRLLPAWILANSPDYGGCKSWIELPETPPHLQFHPVISDGEHASILKRIQEIVQGKI